MFCHILSDLPNSTTKEWPWKTFVLPISNIATLTMLISISMEIRNPIMC